jgi:hypothetical protein
MRQTLCEIVHEVICASGIALADEPARNEFCVSIERNPRPNIASAFRFVLRTAILFLGVNKAPNFVALQALAGEIAQRLVLIFRAGAAKIAKQCHNRCAMHAGHTGDRPQGIYFHQCSDNLCSFFGAQLVHGVHYASALKHRQTEKAKNFQAAIA